MDAVLHWLGENWLQALSAVGMALEIIPGRFHPVSTMLRWIGKRLLGEMNIKLDKLQAEMDANEKDRIRHEVLSFASSCRHGIRHTEDEFRHIIDLHTKYEKLLRRTGDANGVFALEYRYIEELYHHCQVENDFD
ncbi:MAG: hypothetical protein ACI4O7_08215 [Aristaeellaceae bacterium]